MKGRRMLSGDLVKVEVERWRGRGRMRLWRRYFGEVSEVGEEQVIE